MQWEKYDCSGKWYLYPPDNYVFGVLVNGNRVATTLENMENLENSGNLKNCQNLRENSGKFDRS